LKKLKKWRRRVPVPGFSGPQSTFLPLCETGENAIGIAAPVSESPTGDVAENQRSGILSSEGNQVRNLMLIPALFGHFLSSRWNNGCGVPTTLNENRSDELDVPDMDSV
jgi:hypothetical protein